jgi:hypothetical protein
MSFADEVHASNLTCELYIPSLHEMGTFLDTPLVELSRPKRWTSPGCQAYLNSGRSGVHPSRYRTHLEKSAWYIYSKYHYNHITCIYSYYYHYFLSLLL